MDICSIHRENSPYTQHRTDPACSRRIPYLLHSPTVSVRLRTVSVRDHSTFSNTALVRSTELLWPETIRTSSRALRKWMDCLGHHIILDRESSIQFTGIRRRWHTRIWVRSWVLRLEGGCSDFIGLRNWVLWIGQTYSPSEVSLLLQLDWG